MHRAVPRKGGKYSNFLIGFLGETGSGAFVARDLFPRCARHPRIIIKIGNTSWNVCTEFISMRKVEKGELE